MSSTSDLPRISKSDLIDKQRKPSTASGATKRKVSDARNPSPPKTSGPPSKSPRKISTAKTASQIEITEVSPESPETASLKSIKPKPPSGAPSKKVSKKKKSVMSDEPLGLLTSKSASGAAKADVIVSLFEQNVAAWKIRFFIEVVVKKNQAAKFSEEKSQWKKQVKALHKKLTETKEELAKLKQVPAQTAPVRAQGDVDAAAVKADKIRMSQLEEELIVLKAERREMMLKLERATSAAKSNTEIETPVAGSDVERVNQELRQELDATRSKLFEATQQKNDIMLQLDRKLMAEGAGGDRLDQANKTIKLLDEALREFKNRASMFDESSQSNAAERAGLYADLKEAKLKLKEYEAQNEDLSIRSEKANNERRSLERLVTEITVNMHSREKRVAEFKADAEAKNKLVEELTFKLNNHKTEMDIMSRRLHNAETMQKNAQNTLHKSRLTEERATMRMADLEGHVERLVRTVNSSKQYSQMLEEKMNLTKQQAVKFELEVHSKLAAAQKQAEDAEQAAAAYLQGSVHHGRGPMVGHLATINGSDMDQMSDADYALEELELAANNRVMNNRSMRGTSSNTIGSPFPSGRTYGLPNFKSPGPSTRGLGESFALGSTMGGSVDGPNPVEERLVALVSVLENRIDKIEYMTQVMEEEQLSEDELAEEIQIDLIDADDPELEARRLEIQRKDEQRREKAEEKLAVLKEHREVLLKQEAAMIEKVNLAQNAFDKKQIELSEIKGDLMDLQSQMSAMEENNLKMLSELQAWEDEIIATTGEPPTDEERLTKAGRLLEGDKQLHHSFELTQEVAKEITAVADEVNMLREALNALRLQKDVLTNLLKDHRKVEDEVESEIKQLDIAAQQRRKQELDRSEERFKRRRESEEKAAARERKRKLLADKRSARLEKIKSFKKVDLPDLMHKSLNLEESKQVKVEPAPRITMSAISKSLPAQNFPGDETETGKITQMANDVHNVGDRISNILASINNISSNNQNGGVSAGGSVRFQGSRDEEIFYHYAGAEESTFGGDDVYAHLESGTQALVKIDYDNLMRPSQAVREYDRVIQHGRELSPSFSYNDNPQEMASRITGLHEELKALAYQVGECRLCLDRVSFHIRPRRLESIVNWAQAFEEQWGRVPGPADCRSAGSWPLIEAYIRTQRKEYEMYLEIQSLCNEGRFQLKTLHTLLTNYKLLIKSLVMNGTTIPDENLAAYYDESKLPVTSDEVYELHAAFSPLMPPVFDDPVKSLFKVGGPSPSIIYNSPSPVKSKSNQPSTVLSVHPYDPKASIFSERLSPQNSVLAAAPLHVNMPKAKDMFNRDNSNESFSLSLTSDRAMKIPNENSDVVLDLETIYSAQNSVIFNVTEPEVIKEREKNRKDEVRNQIEEITGPLAEEVAMDELYNNIEDLQSALDEALALLQDAKDEYRRQLSRQEFATRELEVWEVAFCSRNPGKVPGKLNEDEKRFGGGGALYDMLERQIQESETQRRRVEALVDIAVEKQLLVDDKTKELQVRQAKFAEIQRQKDARGTRNSSSNTPIKGLSLTNSQLPVIQPSHVTNGNAEGPRRMSLQDMVVLDAGPAGWQQAKDDVLSEIIRIKSEIGVVEAFIGPCDDSLDQFKQRKKKLKQMASFWVTEYKKKNNAEPTEEQKIAELSPIYTEKSEIETREALLTSQRDQAFEILDKLKKVLEQKTTRLDLIEKNIRASSSASVRK